MEFSPIGTLRTPFKSLTGMPIQPGGAKDVTGEAVLLPEYAEGLKDLDGFSHVYLIYQFHKSPEDVRMTVTPFLDRTPRGLFATRAPVRPNPIGLSLVRVLSVEANVIHLAGVDVLDGTPLLDIKPYAPVFDSVSEPRSGWLETAGTDATACRADQRFV